MSLLVKSQISRSSSAALVASNAAVAAAAAIAAAAVANAAGRIAVADAPGGLLLRKLFGEGVLLLFLCN